MSFNDDMALIDGGVTDLHLHNIRNHFEGKK